MIFSAVALIPARGGSKGIKRKNLRLLGGKPLLIYTIESAKKTINPLPIYVSTEDSEIAHCAELNGVEIINRPDALAGDESSMIDVMVHFLKVLEKRGQNPDLVVLLQPTSPLRRTETIDLAIKTFEDNYEYYDSLIPLFPLEGKIGRIKDGMYIPVNECGLRRQNIEPFFRECGTVFIFKSSLIRRGISYGKNILPFIIKRSEEAIDIDDEDDFQEVDIHMRLLNGEKY